ncbi:MAG: AMIN domain-containing protein [Deltaproteobacteria bacterium]|nr:AMIN domain-containing protein [Deltaproteobacteria bacterium]
MTDLGIAEEWGTIMYARPKTIIREKRSMNSSIKGGLVAGQAVKTDFLKDGWYAVFPLTETQRREDKALGYVYTTRLYSQPPKSSVAAPIGKKPPEDKTTISDDKENISINVKNITFKLDDNGKEAILIEFDRFYTPAIFAIPGKSARIVLDIANVSSFRKEWTVINVGGKIIRRIRCNENPLTHMLRIVLDVEPSSDYHVQPVFSERGNIYTLEISEDNSKKESP